MRCLKERLAPHGTLFIMLLDRSQLESREIANLAPYAARSVESRGRSFDEPESEFRTAFQKDRDRVVHTTAFRRLEYKTQVFVNDEGDHYRTRLTHTLEVAQVAKAICRALGANEDLAETIALAHDLGHPPFGHAGEASLNHLAASEGGFDHNKQSLRIVTQLERRYPNFDGLNLTWETLEGIMKHETEYDLPDGNWEPHKRPTLEAQVVNLADEMAYNAHDLDDGLRAGILDPRSLHEVTAVSRIVSAFDMDLANFTSADRALLVRELLGASIMDAIRATHEQVSDANVHSVDDVRNQTSPLATLGERANTEAKELKTFLYANLYRHHRQIRMARKADRLLREIFEAYLASPEMLPSEWQHAVQARGIVRAVTDYMAGFTDRFANEEYRRLFDPGILT